MIKLILAADKAFGIGLDNKLLAHLPEDLAYFKKQTENQIVLMGNNTFKSLQALGMQNGLPNRLNVVLSKTPVKTPFLQEGVVTYISDLSRFLEWGVMYATTILQKDIYVIGGASIYAQLKDFAQEIHWTKIDKTYEADTHFNMEWVQDENVFDKVSEEVLCEETEDKPSASVCVYKRK